MIECSTLSKHSFTTSTWPSFTAYITGYQPWERHIGSCCKVWILSTHSIIKGLWAAKGGERACYINSPHVDGEILHVTKNNTSAHAREYECTNRKQIDTIEHGPLQTCTKITQTIKWCTHRVFRNHTSHTFILVTFKISVSTCIACPLATLGGLISPWCYVLSSW